MLRFKKQEKEGCFYDPYKSSSATVAERVTSSLKWILWHSREGQCKKDATQPSLEDNFCITLLGVYYNCRTNYVPTVQYIATCKLVVIDRMLVVPTVLDDSPTKWCKLIQVTMEEKASGDEFTMEEFKKVRHMTQECPTTTMSPVTYAPFPD